MEEEIKKEAESPYKDNVTNSMKRSDEPKENRPAKYV